MSDENPTTEGQEDQPVAELAAMRSKNSELLNELKDARKALKRFDGIDPEQYAELVEAHEQAEADRAKAAGDWDKREAALQKKLSEKDSIIADQDAKFRTALKERDAALAIGQHGGNEKLLLRNVLDALDVDDDYNVVATVDGKQMSALDYVGTLKADDDYAGAFPAAGVAGSGAKGGRASPSTSGFKMPEGIEILN